MSDVNYEALNKPFPKEAIKRRKGNGGIFLDYVETHTVIRRLIEATGNNFDFRVLHIDQTDDVVMATVELDIPGLGKRQHVGTARVAGNPDDCVKAAISDSIKKCFSLFSIGYLGLWGPDYEAERPQVAPIAQPTQPQPQVRTANGTPVNRAVAMAGRSSYRP